MNKTINQNDFVDAFQAIRPEKFSYDGLRALFSYLEDLDEQCDTETELDVIAICCDFTEYEDLEEIQGNYNDIESIENLQDHTTVIEFSGGIIIQVY